MVGDRGGVATAKYLLNTEQPSSGYVRLWQADRLICQSRLLRSKTLGGPYSLRMNWRQRAKD